MHKEKITLEHKKLLDERLRAVDTALSEYSFANIYLFRQAHDYELIIGDDLFIKGITYDGKTYIMPTRDMKSVDIKLLKQLLQDVDFAFPIPEEWLKFFDPQEFAFDYTEGDMDYIYTVEKMSTYKGRHLHSKRNLLKQFMQTYSHKALPLTYDLLNDAREIAFKWQEESGLDPLLTDFNPCMEAIDLYNELSICGGIYYADNKPAGFILGEELNHNTFALHFAKASKKFKGIYQYMYNNFAKVLSPNYKFLNFEQDLDKEMLRIAKSSYLPDAKLKKYRVTLR